jgi:excinuclease ABC subunit B
MQLAHNKQFNITPTTVSKSVDQVRFITRVADARGEREEKRVAEPARGYSAMDVGQLEAMLEQQMKEAAVAMDFELAAQLRDQLFELRARGANPKAASSPAQPRRARSRR